MNVYEIYGRYYQFTGKIREWLGSVWDDLEAVEAGRNDQLVGRIAEHCHKSIEEAESLAHGVEYCRQV